MKYLLHLLYFEAAISRLCGAQVLFTQDFTINIPLEKQLQ